MSEYHLGGKDYIFEISAYPSRRGLSVFTKDITEGVQAEKALRVSEDRYRDLVEHSQDLICTHDLNGQILSANQGAEKLLGYDHTDLLTMNMRDVLAPEVRNEFDKYLFTIREQGAASGLMLVQTRTGERRIWEYNNTLRMEGVATPIVRGMAQDITERMRAEEALRRSEEEARRLAEENRVVAEIGRIISSTLKIEEVYEHFSEEARKLISLDRISITIITPDQQSATIAYVSGDKIEDRHQAEVVPLAGSPTEEIIRTRSPLLIQTEDEEEIRNCFPKLVSTFRAGFRSLISVPLISKDKVIGALHLRSIKPNAYTDRDVNAAERVGNQIAGAIANSQLFSDRERVEKERMVLKSSCVRRKRWRPSGLWRVGLPTISTISWVVFWDMPSSPAWIFQRDPKPKSICSSRSSPLIGPRIWCSRSWLSVARANRNGNHWISGRSSKRL